MNDTDKELCDGIAQSSPNSFGASYFFRYYFPGLIYMKLGLKDFSADPYIFEQTLQYNLFRNCLKYAKYTNICSVHQMSFSTVILFGNIQI